MANPLDSLKNLKPWQQGAVVIGGIGVVGLVVWQRQKESKAKAAAAAAPAAAGAVPAAAGTTDPTTGQVYPDGAVDPETGQPYAQEIAEYGSVSAADSVIGSGSLGQSGGLGSNGGYVEQTPQQASTGSTVTTNAQWMAEVETGLSEQNYTASDIGQGLAAYFAGKPLSTTSDGTNLYTMMNLAVSEYGPPPTGSYPLLIGSKTPTPAAAKVKVPNVVGMDVEQATVTLSAAGLKESGPAGVKDVVHVVTGTTPAVGTSVAPGSVVTLKYKSDSEAPPKAKAK
jgi:hypothetical protein